MICSSERGRESSGEREEGRKGRVGWREEGGRLCFPWCGGGREGGMAGQAGVGSKALLL